MNNQAVIDQLQKILALADEGSGATEAEMQTAMAMAQKLALKHNLDLAAVMASGSAEEKSNAIKTERTDLKPRGASLQTEHRYIFRVLQQVFDVDVIMFGRRGFCLVGEKTDVAMAQFAFKFLENTYSKLMRRFIREVRCRDGYGTADEQHSFYSGLSRGIISANQRHKAEAKAENPGYTLVLVNKEAIVKARVAQEFPKLKITKQRDFDYDDSAASHGMEAGRKIKLNSQLEGNNNQSLQ